MFIFVWLEIWRWGGQCDKPDTKTSERGSIPWICSRGWQAAKESETILLCKCSASTKGKGRRKPEKKGVYIFNFGSFLMSGQILRMNAIKSYSS